MVKPAMIAGALILAPAMGLSGCTSDDEPAGDQPAAESPTTSVAPGTERLSTQLKTADGTPLAEATFDFANGYATVTVETVANGILSPGFHGLHVHSVGKCESNSVAPTGGPSGDFNSAGGHFQAPGHTGHPASGDLTSLQVRSDGAARVVTTTDSFTAQDLMAGEGTALIIHEGPDNFANIPTDRYEQRNGAAGPDQDTMATGDSGGRVACGVIESASTTTTTTTSTTTTTTTTTTAPPTTITETIVPTSPTTTTSPPPPTTTPPPTVTITVPTITTVPGNPLVPGIPGPPNPPG